MPTNMMGKCQTYMGRPSEFQLPGTSYKANHTGDGRKRFSALRGPLKRDVPQRRVKRKRKNYNLFNINKIRIDLINLGANKIDYVENYNIKSFKRILKSNKNFNLFFAYYIKDIRLIDNI